MNVTALKEQLEGMLEDLVTLRVTTVIVDSIELKHLATKEATALLQDRMAQAHRVGSTRDAVPDAGDDADDDDLLGEPVARPTASTTVDKPPDSLATALSDELEHLALLGLLPPSPSTAEDADLLGPGLAASGSAEMPKIKQPETLKHRLAVQRPLLMAPARRKGAVVITSSFTLDGDQLNQVERSFLNEEHSEAMLAMHQQSVAIGVGWWKSLVDVLVGFIKSIGGLT